MHGPAIASRPDARFIIGPMGNWTLESIAWDRFDASKVDPEILRNIKAAALVERNGGDYRVYLNRVFANDADFQAAVDAWASEEIQHGMALGSPHEVPALTNWQRVTPADINANRAAFAWIDVNKARFSATGWSGSPHT